MRCVGGWRGGRRGPIVSLFPYTPLLTRPPSGAASCRAVPDLEGVPSAGDGVCVDNERIREREPRSKALAW
ncbi:hypothetical protein P7K49_016608 [Saguinus oedipus]|uniref:Uncharacterized protein n=1 Tax=Saguinus oedipus TaxID=9490 RepID=A0ABQ9VDW3_SAGOE|nr:hypothetical protein P7K49_016608 [Saguinus oedipus]